MAFVSSSVRFDSRTFVFLRIDDRGGIITAEPDRLEVSAHGWSERSYSGHGFEYEISQREGGGSYYDFTAGVVTSYRSGFDVFYTSVYELNISAKLLSDAAKTASVEDDRALFVSQLQGNDTFNGKDEDWDLRPPSDFENYFDGLAGDDTLNGGLGADQLFGNLGNDILRGGEHDDLLDGGAGNDVLLGGFGADVISGASGNDNMNGEDDDDTLNGGTGDDRFGGGAGIDVIDGGSGFDTAFYRDKTAAVVVKLNRSADVVVSVGGVAEDTLRNIENVTGGSGNDTLAGDGAANVLGGSVGADIMRGGLGDDTYYVDNALDRTIEANGAGTGTDTVHSSVSKAFFDQFIEIIRLTGSANINTTGNNLANTIVGNGGNNGINGSAGSDTLSGGLGRDSFVFNTALGVGNIDRITDYNVADDTIQLDDAIFTEAIGSGAGGLGTLLAGQFRASATGLAQDADDRIIYETDTGRIYYDSNGNAAGGNWLFADLASGLAVTAADFLVI